jgi:hypothetical protein
MVRDQTASRLGLGVMAISEMRGATHFHSTKLVCADDCNFRATPDSTVPERAEQVKALSRNRGVFLMIGSDE